MSEPNTDPAGADPQSDPKPATEAKPPWGSDEEFSPEKAWNLIQNLRTDLEKTKPAVQRLREIEDANKTELQKITERAEAAERRASQAELAALRTRVAAELNVPVEVLHGDTEESIRAAGQKVLEWAGTGRRPAPPVTALKSGSTAEDISGMTGKQRAAALLRQMRTTG